MVALVIYQILKPSLKDCIASIQCICFCLYLLSIYQKLEGTHKRLSLSKVSAYKKQTYIHLLQHQTIHNKYRLQKLVAT